MQTAHDFSEWPNFDCVCTCPHAEGPARGAYIDARHTRGGAGILHVTSNPEYSDEEQMFAGGYLEGYLTAGHELAAPSGSLALLKWATSQTTHSAASMCFWNASLQMLGILGP